MCPSPYCWQHLPVVAIAHLASQVKEVKHGEGERIPWPHPFLLGWMQLAGVIRAAFIPSSEASPLPWSPSYGWWTHSTPSGSYQCQPAQQGLGKIKTKSNLSRSFKIFICIFFATPDFFLSPLISPFAGIYTVLAGPTGWKPFIPLQLESREMFIFFLFSQT